MKCAISALLLLPSALLAQVGNEKKPAPPVVERKPIEREVREIEGWKIHVDKQLLAAENDLAARALKVLGYKLYEISKLVPESRLVKLRAVGIVVDLDYPGLTPMQYHPSSKWLKDNGHDPVALAKKVHIPKGTDLVSRKPIDQQPMVILHELAHAYHDQVLSFEEPRVKEAWIRFKESGKFEKTLHITGSTRKHYALTNQMEFFAEMTESFFGTNDFFPFVRGELKQELPEVHKLLTEVWGTAP